MTESVQSKKKSSKTPVTPVFTVQDIIDFLQEQVGIENLRMDVRSVYPHPFEPNSSVQNFRINFYKSVIRENSNIPFEVMQESKFIQVRIDEGYLTCVKMAS